MRSRTTLLMLATMLAAPTALAGWAGLGGSPEPSTGSDLADGTMWTTPNAAAQDRVYFDAVLVSVQPHANPNVPGLDATGHATVLPVAVLGYWRDCNRDGFLGSALLGAVDYPATPFTVDETVCPPGTPHHRADPATGAAWISELRAIGPYADCPWCAAVANPLLLTRGASPDVNDTEARVWGDLSIPQDPIPAMPKDRVDVPFEFRPRGSLVGWECDGMGCVPPGCAPGPDDGPICPWPPPQPDPLPDPPCTPENPWPCPDDQGPVAGWGLWVGEPLRLGRLDTLDRFGFTAYADVGGVVHQIGGIRGGGIQRIYGDEACGSATTGVGATNWQCDPAEWEGDVKRGDAYELRDVDCYGFGSARLDGQPDAC